MSSSAITAAEVNNILVSGLTQFLESRWRDAILYYLNGILANRKSVVYRPGIQFGNITLRLNQHSGEYFAYGPSEACAPRALSDVSANDLLVELSGNQEAVERALARFVRNDRIKQLRLFLPAVNGCSAVILWKKERRSEYGCVGLNLPCDWLAHGPVW
jgi:hypothetical protein